MVIPLGFDLCDPSWFIFGSAGPGYLPGSQVLKIILLFIYTFMKARNIRRFLQRVRIISEMGDDLVADGRNKNGTTCVQERFFTRWPQ
jgi:hypothetical protein